MENVTKRARGGGGENDIFYWEKSKHKETEDRCLNGGKEI